MKQRLSSDDFRKLRTNIYQDLDENNEFKSMFDDFKDPSYTAMGQTLLWEGVKNYKELGFRSKKEAMRNERETMRRAYMFNAATSIVSTFERSLFSKQMSKENTLETIDEAYKLFLNDPLESEINLKKGIQYLSRTDSEGEAFITNLFGEKIHSDITRGIDIGNSFTAFADKAFGNTLMYSLFGRMLTEEGISMAPFSTGKSYVASAIRENLMYAPEEDKMLGKTARTVASVASIATPIVETTLLGKFGGTNLIFASNMLKGVFGDYYYNSGTAEQLNFEKFASGLVHNALSSAIGMGVGQIATSYLTGLEPRHIPNALREALTVVPDAINGAQRTNPMAFFKLAALTISNHASNVAFDTIVDYVLYETMSRMGIDFIEGTDQMYSINHIKRREEEKAKFLTETTGQRVDPNYALAIGGSMMRSIGRRMATAMASNLGKKAFFYRKANQQGELFTANWRKEHDDIFQILEDNHKTTTRLGYNIARLTTWAYPGSIAQMDTFIKNNVDMSKTYQRGLTDYLLYGGNEREQAHVLASLFVTNELSSNTILQGVAKRAGWTSGDLRHMFSKNYLKNNFNADTFSILNDVLFPGERGTTYEDRVHYNISQALSGGLSANRYELNDIDKFIEGFRSHVYYSGHFSGTLGAKGRDYDYFFRLMSDPNTLSGQIIANPMNYVKNLEEAVNVLNNTIVNQNLDSYDRTRLSDEVTRTIGLFRGLTSKFNRDEGFNTREIIQRLDSLKLRAPKDDVARNENLAFNPFAESLIRSGAVTLIGNQAQTQGIIDSINFLRNLEQDRSSLDDVRGLLQMTDAQSMFDYMARKNGIRPDLLRTIITDVGTLANNQRQPGDSINDIAARVRTASVEMLDGSIKNLKNYINNKELHSVDAQNRRVAAELERYVTLKSLLGDRLELGYLTNLTKEERTISKQARAITIAYLSKQYDPEIKDVQNIFDYHNQIIEVNKMAKGFFVDYDQLYKGRRLEPSASIYDFGAVTAMQQRTPDTSNRKFLEVIVNGNPEVVESTNSSANGILITNRFLEAGLSDWGKYDSRALRNAVIESIRTNLWTSYMTKGYTFDGAVEDVNEMLRSYGNGVKVNSFDNGVIDITIKDGMHPSDLNKYGEMSLNAYATIADASPGIQKEVANIRFDNDRNGLITVGAKTMRPVDILKEIKKVPGLIQEIESGFRYNMDFSEAQHHVRNVLLSHPTLHKYVNTNYYYNSTNRGTAAVDTIIRHLATTPKTRDISIEFSSTGMVKAVAAGTAFDAVIKGPNYTYYTVSFDNIEDEKKRAEAKETVLNMGLIPSIIGGSQGNTNEFLEIAGWKNADAQKRATLLKGVLQDVYARTLFPILSEDHVLHTLIPALRSGNTDTLFNEYRNTYITIGNTTPNNNLFALLENSNNFTALRYLYSDESNNLKNPQELAKAIINHTYSDDRLAAYERWAKDYNSRILRKFNAEVGHRGRTSSDDETVNAFKALFSRIEIEHDYFDFPANELSDKLAALYLDIANETESDAIAAGHIEIIPYKDSSGVARTGRAITDEGYKYLTAFSPTDAQELINKPIFTIFDNGIKLISSVLSGNQEGKSFKELNDIKQNIVTSFSHELLSRMPNGKSHKEDILNLLANSIKVNQQLRDDLSYVKDSVEKNNFTGITEKVRDRIFKEIDRSRSLFDNTYIDNIEAALGRNKFNNYNEFFREMELLESKNVLFEDLQIPLRNIRISINKFRDRAISNEGNAVSYLLADALSDGNFSKDLSYSQIKRMNARQTFNSTPSFILNRLESEIERLIGDELRVVFYDDTRRKKDGLSAVDGELFMGRGLARVFQNALAEHPHSAPKISNKMFGTLTKAVINVDPDMVALLTGDITEALSDNMIVIPISNVKNTGGILPRLLLENGVRNSDGSTITLTIPRMLGNRPNFAYRAALESFILHQEIPQGKIDTTISPQIYINPGSGFMKPPIDQGTINTSMNKMFEKLNAAVQAGEIITQDLLNNTFKATIRKMSDQPGSYSIISETNNMVMSSRNLSGESILLLDYNNTTNRFSAPTAEGSIDVDVSASTQIGRLAENVLQIYEARGKIETSVSSAELSLATKLYDASQRGEDFYDRDTTAMQRDFRILAKPLVEAGYLVEKVYNRNKPNEQRVYYRMFNRASNDGTLHYNPILLAEVRDTGTSIQTYLTRRATYLQGGDWDGDALTETRIDSAGFDTMVKDGLLLFGRNSSGFDSDPVSHINQYTQILYEIQEQNNLMHDMISGMNEFTDNNMAMYGGRVMADISETNQAFALVGNPKGSINVPSRKIEIEVSPKVANELATQKLKETIEFDLKANLFGNKNAVFFFSKDPDNIFQAENITKGFEVVEVDRINNYIIHTVKGFVGLNDNTMPSKAYVVSEATRNKLGDKVLFIADGTDASRKGSIIDDIRQNRINNTIFEYSKYTPSSIILTKDMYITSSGRMLNSASAPFVDNPKQNQGAVLVATDINVNKYASEFITAYKEIKLKQAVTSIFEFKKGTQYFEGSPDRLINLSLGAFDSYSKVIMNTIGLQPVSPNRLNEIKQLTSNEDTEAINDLLGKLNHTVSLIKYAHGFMHKSTTERDKKKEKEIFKIIEDHPISSSSFNILPYSIQVLSQLKPYITNILEGGQTQFNWSNYRDRLPSEVLHSVMGHEDDKEIDMVQLDKILSAEYANLIYNVNSIGTYLTEVGDNYASGIHGAVERIQQARKVEIGIDRAESLDRFVDIIFDDITDRNISRDHIEYVFNKLDIGMKNRSTYKRAGLAPALRVHPDPLTNGKKYQTPTVTNKLENQLIVNGTREVLTAESLVSRMENLMRKINNPEYSRNLGVIYTSIIDNVNAESKLALITHVNGGSKFINTLNKIITFENGDWRFKGDEKSIEELTTGKIIPARNADKVLYINRSKHATFKAKC